MTRRRVWLIVGLGLVAVLTGWSAWWTAPERAFRSYVAAMRADGEPITVAETDGPMPPDVDNAATEINAALDWVAATVDPAVPRPTCFDTASALDGPQSGDERSDAERYVERLQPFLDRVSSALGRPRCRFIAPDAVSYADQMPARARIRSSIGLLGGISLFARETDRRIDACATMATFVARLERVDRSIQDGGEVIRRCVAVVRAGIETDGWSARQARARLDGPLSERWLVRVRKDLAAERAYRLERPLGLLEAQDSLGLVDSVLARYRGPSFCAHGEQDGGPPAAKLLTTAMDDAEFLRRASRLPTDSYVQFRTGWIELDQETGGQRSGRLPSYVSPWQEMDATTRLARIALAAAEHRATHGDFPASLDELKPMFPDGLPLDPYTDAPFAYARTATGARIASLGRLPEETPLDDATLRERVLLWELKR